MVTIAVATAHGLGRHAFTLSDEDQKIYGITVFIQAIFTTVTSLCFLKLSVAFSLLRMSSPINKWWTRVIWGLVGETLTFSQGILPRIGRDRQGKTGRDFIADMRTSSFHLSLHDRELDLDSRLL